MGGEVLDPGRTRSLRATLGAAAASLLQCGLLAWGPDDIPCSCRGRGLQQLFGIKLRQLPGPRLYKGGVCIWLVGGSLCLLCSWRYSGKGRL